MKMNVNRTITKEYKGIKTLVKLADIEKLLNDIFETAYSANNFISKVTLSLTDETEKMSHEDNYTLDMWYYYKNESNTISLYDIAKNS